MSRQHNKNEKRRRRQRYVRRKRDQAKTTLATKGNKAGNSPTA